MTHMNKKHMNKQKPNLRVRISKWEDHMIRQLQELDEECYNNGLAKAQICDIARILLERTKKIRVILEDEKVI